MSAREKPKFNNRSSASTSTATTSINSYANLLTISLAALVLRLTGVSQGDMGKKTEKKIKRKLKKAKAKANAAEAKKVVVVPVIKGSGDYKVNQFSRMRGRGDYFSDLGSNLLGGLGRTVGGGLGSLVGGALKSITGMGDYRTKGAKTNSLNGLFTTGEGTPFQMSEMGAKFAGGPPRIQHREFIGTILSPTSPGDFNTQVYYIQPGLKTSTSLFPWVSSVAQCFEQYRLHGMILEYVSTTADFAAAAGLGQVALSTLYDAAATPLASLSEVLNNEWTTTAKPSVSFVHPIECGGSDNQVTLRYVRSGNSSSDSDVRLDDVGVFQVTTFGLSATAGTQIGELWATYDIEFYKPVLPDSHVGTTFHATQTRVIPATSGNVTFYPLLNGATPDITVALGSSLPAKLVPRLSSGAVVGTDLVMPMGYGGNYLINIFAVDQSGGTITAGSFNIPSGASKGITALNLLPANGSPATSTSVFFSSAAYDTGVSAATFSFDGAQDSIIQIGNWIINSSSGTTVYSGLLVVPLDNDVLSLSDAMRMALKRKFGGLPDALSSALISMATLQEPIGVASGSPPPPPRATCATAEVILDDGLLPAAPPPREAAPSRRDSDAEADAVMRAVAQLTPAELVRRFGPIRQ